MICCNYWGKHYPLAVNSMNVCLFDRKLGCNWTGENIIAS